MGLLFMKINLDKEEENNELPFHFIIKHKKKEKNKIQEFSPNTKINLRSIFMFKDKSNENLIQDNISIVKNQELENPFIRNKRISISGKRSLGVNIHNVDNYLSSDVESNTAEEITDDIDTIKEFEDLTDEST